MKFAYDIYSGPEGSDTILFLHGLACSRKSFNSTIRAGHLKKYRILNIDLIGFGEADKPEDFDYRMESQAGLLNEFLDSLGEFERLHIVAHSMGGAVGLLMADSPKNRLVSFANLEGNLISSDCDMFSRRVIRLPEKTYRSRMFAKHRKAFKNDAAFDFDNTTAEAVYRSSRSLVEWSDSGKLLQRFRVLNCRKAYFYGEENRAMPVLERLEDIPEIEIPEAGHCMMTDKPVLFSRALLEFLQNG